MASPAGGVYAIRDPGPRVEWQVEIAAVESELDGRYAFVAGAD